MTQEQLSFDRYARMVWRAKWVIIAAAILAALMAALISYRQPPQHKATALLKIGRVWKEPIEDYFVTERVANTQSFLKGAANRVGLNAPQLRRSVHVEAILAGPRRNRAPVLLQITANADTAENAARNADAVAQEIVARHQTIMDETLKPHIERQHQLEARQKELESQQSSRELLLKIDAELDEVRTNNSLSNSPVTEKTHVVAEPTAEPVPRPSIVRAAGFAGSIAAVSAAILAALAVHLPQQSSPTQNDSDN